MKMENYNDLKKKNSNMKNQMQKNFVKWQFSRITKLHDKMSVNSKIQMISKLFQLISAFQCMAGSKIKTSKTLIFPVLIQKSVWKK